MIDVTIDANIVRDICDGTRRSGYKHAQELVALAREGRIALRVTTRIASDIPRDPLRAQVDALPDFQTPRASSIGRVDHSRIDEDHIPSDEEASETERLMTLLFPLKSPSSRSFKNCCADVDHLIAHKVSGANVFITEDSRILEHAGELAEKCQIVAMSPEEFLNWFPGI